MSVTAIISEYNPFHNGHKYNLEMAKKISGSDYVITIMSGSFLQRGEPALFDKWSRAKMAVLNGVDLVIELPVLYACQPAENFAYGAIKILNSLKIIDYLCFGSESGKIEDLKKIAIMLIDEPEDFKSIVKKKMSLGLSYPKALGDAIEDVLGNSLNLPNNLLGIEYIKSILALKSSIKPITIKRIANEYNETHMSGSISSATAIREEMRKNGLTENISVSVPKNSYNIIKYNMEICRGPVFLEDYSDIVLYQLRKSHISQLNKVPYIKEGLEFRLKKQANMASDIYELINSTKTKRYTRTYIQRMLCHILLCITNEDTNNSKKNQSPVYIRVLAFNKKGRELLKEIRKNSPYPLIIKTADFNSKNKFLNRMFELDTLSTDIYNIAMKNPKFKKARDDYRTSPLYVEES